MLVAGLGLSSSALAGPDELKGGTVVLQPKGSGGLKVKPKSLTLGITKGKVDPLTGAGEVTASGKLKLKRGKRGTKIKITSLTFGASGSPGGFAAKVGKKNVGNFGKLSGGTVTRDGFGAKIDGVTAKLGKKGAGALRKALTPGRRGGASAAAGRLKAGRRLGTLTVKTVPKTVEILPGGSTILATDPGLVTKLAAHCINGLPGEGGVYPIPPATQDPVTAAFTFPVTGGQIAPDFTDGRIITGGGQVITKNLGLPPCDASPAVGTSIISTNFQTEFAGNLFSADSLLPTGPLGVAALGNVNFNTGSRSIDPNTKKVTVTGATVTLQPLAADVLNTVFPNRSGIASEDFRPGDLLGHLSITATTH